MKIITKCPVFWQALVTAASSYKALTEAVSTDGITLGAISNGSSWVTLASSASLEVPSAEAKKSRLASVASGTFNKVFAPTLSSDETQNWIVLSVAESAVKRAVWVAVTGFTHVAIPDVLGGVFVVERFAQLTVPPHCIVLAVITNASARVPGGQVHRHVEMTLSGMVVAIALFTSICASSFSWSPGMVIEETVTLLTVQPFGVVFTHTSAMNHALAIPGDSLDWRTLRGMSITEAVSSDHQLIQRIIILLFDLLAGIEEVVAQRVQSGEINPQVGNFEKTLDPGAIRVSDWDCWIQHSVYHLSFCGRLNIRVAGFTDNVVHFSLGASGDIREDGRTVISKVAVHLPTSTEV